MVRKKILLVEDDGIEAMDIKRTLESFDYEVPYVASSGGEAIKKALEIQPDLILMDIVLKGEINGIDAAHKIKELSIPLIYLTAHSEDSTVQKAKFTEPYGYIIKPYDSSELKYAIELALYKSKMEKRLKESEMRYRFIVEAANEGIWSMGADFNTTYVNQKMAEMLGYNAEEMLGKPVTSFMFEEDIPDHEEHIKSRLEGVSENYERRLKHKDGSEVFTLVAATVLKDINGNFNGSFGMFTDITHRKEMEKQLNDSTSQLFHIIDNSPILQFVIDKNHRVLYWNQAMASYSGISPEEIIGTDQHWKAFYNGKRPCLADLILDGDILPVEKWYSGKYKESEYLKGVYEVEDYFPSMGETGKWLHFTAAPIKDSEGKIIWVLETLEDITERKKAEYALRESEEKFRVLAENAPVSIVVYQDDKTVYVNDYAAKISGYSKEELYVMNFWDAFHPDDQKLIKRRGKARLRGAEVSKKYEVRYITKSGELRYIVLSAGKIIYGGKPAVLAILVDITEHKIVENRLKKSEECLMMGMGMAKLVYWEYDIKNDLFTFDDQFYSLYGTSTKQEGGNKMSSQEYANRFVPTEERALVGEEVAKALETDDPNYSSAIQHSIIRSDGERRFIIVRIRMLLDDNGQKIGTRGVNQDITELILAEEKLARSESKYRAIFDNIKSAVAVYNAIDGGSDFVFKDFNHAAEEIEKIKMENVVGKKVTEVFPAVVEFGLMEVFKRVWETGKPEKHPVSIYKDERIGGWRENYVYKLPSDDIVAVYDDLTEIKQYEEELEQNQNRLRSLVRILQYRAESVQDFLDYAVEEAIGLTGSKIGYIYHYHEEREEFILNTWSKDVMDECSITDQPTVYKLEKTGIWGEAVRQRKPIMLNDFQAENPLKKGYPKGHAPIHKFMTLPLFAGGKIVAVVGMANKETNYTETDILQLELLMDGVWKVVDTQRAEEALKKSEIRYRAIFENTGTATAISEDNTILSLVNEEFANLTGFSKKEIENKMTWVHFFVEEEIPRMKEYHKLRRVDPNAVPRNYETVFKDRWGNTKEVYMSVAMLPDTKKSLVSVLDITEKKESRKKLRQELKINQSLANVYVPLISPLTTIQDISIVILKEVLSLTGSEHGFVATIDPENQDLLNQTLTRMMHGCEVYADGEIPEEIRFHVGVDGKYPGLWGHCLNIKEAFYTNNAQKHPSSKGAPSGHVKIDKFLAVPVFIDDEPMGEIALANPLKKDYSKHDLKAVKRIADFFALAIQRKGYEEQINRSLDEKDLLLREIHHRVKNNMQIISSILNLQSFTVTDPELLDILKQNQNRIKSMAMIHEKLYQSPNLLQIDFSDYLNSLTADLVYTYLIKDRGIEIDLDLEKDIMLNIETSILCGLIYSELLSNSIKHAFPDIKGRIKVKLKRLDDYIMLNVSDNGIGLPQEIDFIKTDTLGLQLINSLVKQIDGTIKLDRVNGTSFTVKFQELKYKDRM
ncbi:hypothetical protein BK008_07955 [Methanobacterium sp. MZ-A1]|uniref:PAS domain S-box protein n=1 Tax=Methanobacterium sp. MZ-A1 TaxID=1911685 RepID=UPI000C2D42D6|nr:PAS domain S-box protein [Methanobacterium sp. MZ-A1]AUB58253.1 hypothetical protein BK008_07955 [Methanobacterium sp. MZ-A1]MBW4256907.1 PAS domain S-box protein [Methanobacterium sp. YSL]